VTLGLLAENAAWVVGLMVILWIVSVARRDASLVDPWWSMAFLLVTVNTVRATGLTPAKALLLIAVGAWALRLWLHLLLRSRGRPEDPRYAAFRQRYGAERYWWISFFQVFLLQGCLVVLISAPLQLATAAPGPDPLALSHVAGLLVAVIGFGFEVIADTQLVRFRADRMRRDGVLDTGLWQYSRHPNYFGEALLWWGFWLFAVGQPYGWVSALSPMLMTFLLLKVSGVAMLDAHLGSRKPGYQSYIQRTSAFVPWPRRPQT
jgi:steroid 5-alpha reductase family enzyme